MTKMIHPKKILPAWIILAFILTFSQIHAQQPEHTFTGKVTDTNNRPLEFATAALYSTDSALVGGSVTDHTGTFRIGHTKVGHYTLEVRLIGYETVHRTIDLRGSNTDAGTIILTETGLGLNEVTVTAEAPAVRQLSDRLIVRPEAYMFISGKKASDVLRELPGVISEPSGGLSVVGKSAAIYINGKPADLTGTTVSRLLQTLQAERIERVEIITNPSARYEAAHSGAIIDIRLRRDESVGYNGTASVSSYLKTTGLTFAPSLSANYRNGRMNLYGSYGLNTGRYEQIFHNVNRYHALDVPLEYTEHGIYRPRGTSHDASLGLDWYPTERHTLGFLTQFGRYDGSNLNRTTTDIRRLDAARVDSGIISPLSMDIYNNYLSIDLNHAWAISKETRLTTDAVYTYADHNQEQQMVLNYVDAAGRPLRPHDGSGHGVFQKTNAWMLKTDFEGSLPLGLHFETGAQWMRVRRDNDLKGLTLSADDRWTENFLQSNHFIYKEQVTGLYINLTRSWGDRLNFSAGLRGEHTFQDGFQAMSDTGFTRRRFDFFPSASAQYRFGKDQSLSLSYARKVDRPSFSSLNPFRFYTSPNEYQEGNPDLLPSFRHNLQLIYSLRRYSLTLSYTRTTGMIIGEPSQDDATRRKRYLYTNFGRSDLYTLSLNIPLRLHSRWSANFNANGLCRSYRSRFMGEDFRKTFVYAYARLSNRFDCGSGWKIQFNGFFQTPYWHLARHYKASGMMDLAVEKSLWGGRGTLSATLIDPFRWNTSYYTLRFGNIDNEGWGISDYRSIRLDFSYRFGSDKVKQSRRRRTGAESLNSRL